MRKIVDLKNDFYSNKIHACYFQLQAGKLLLNSFRNQKKQQMKARQLEVPDRFNPNQDHLKSKSKQSKKLKLQPLQNHFKIIQTQEKINKQEDSKKVESPSKISCEQSKKQRKFIADQYDEKAVILCQFCGGETCPQEDYLTNKIQPNAIQGLHSNWISENILATQRPSNRLIQKFNLIKTFHKYGINTILNLQQPGQHPYCGDGIDAMVGFSYNPQLFFTNEIRFENQFWEDMTSTSFQQMMKIMNIFQRSILRNRGKIAVHCHAGRGRTLMAINAWLIYNDRMTAQQTIELAVLKRQGVLTKTSQRDFLREFQAECQKRWRNYHHELVNEQINTITQFVSWQNVSLLKVQLLQLNEKPFLHGTIVSILRKRIKQSYKEIIYAFIDFSHPQVFREKKWDNEHQHRLSFLKTYLDKKITSKIHENQDVRILVALLEDFYDNLPFTSISLHAIDQLKKQSEVQTKILKDPKSKRSVKKQCLHNKVLKNWSDLKEQKQKQKPLGLQSRIKQNSGQAKQGEQESREGRSDQDIFNIQTQNNQKMVTIQSRIQNEDAYSQIESSSFYLNILTQPSIVHQVGIHSLCTFIDFVKLAGELMQIYRQNNRSQSQKEIRIIEKCLLAKFSLILQSKKRFFPVLFRGPHLRQSHLKSKIQKIDKYANSNIKYIAETFMEGLMKELSPILADQEKFKKLIFKLKKVDANLNHFSKSHASSGGRFFSAIDAKKVYDSARIQ